MIEVAPSGTPEPAPPADGPTEAVAEMVRGLTKALRVHLLYEGSSPSLERFLDMLRTRMALLWEQLPHLTLAVEEDALLWNGATVYTAEERNDNFAFLFYKDGVREIGFLPGFERDELDVLVGILARVQRIREDEEDLLTLLWEHDLSRFRYQHVEVLTEGVEIPSVSARSRSPIPPPLTPTSLTPANFEGTLHFLEDAELRRLADELRLELDRDLWGDVLSALFDRLEDGREERQLRVVGTLHDLFPTLLGSGNLAAATRVLRELATLAAGDSPLPPAVLRAIREMFARLAAPETVREIVRAIEESPASFTEDQVALLLRFFPAEALPALIRAAETTSVGAVRDPMIRAAERLAATEPERLIPLVEDADDVLATGAARLVGKIGIPAAAPAVVGLLRRSHAPVRLVAIGVLQTLRTPASGAALQEALDDSDREVRIAATRALASLRFTPARDRLRAAVSSRRVRELDLTERIALFEAFGSVADESGIELLGRTLNGKSLLGRREAPEMRACAALGLGRSAAPSARTLLASAAGEIEPVVRSAVTRALRGEGA